MTTIICQMKLLKRKVFLLTAREMEIKMNYAKQRNYEFANKPGKVVGIQAVKRKRKKKKESDIKVTRRKYCNNR